MLLKTGSNACICKNTEPVNDDYSGEIICRNCGVVLEQHTEARSTATVLAFSKNVPISDRNFIETLSLLDKTLSQISPTSTIRHTAYGIASKLNKKNKRITPYTKEVTCAAIVYVSSKACSRMFSAEHIAKKFNVSEKQLAKTIRIILNEIDIAMPTQREIISGIISKACNEMKLSNKNQEILSHYDYLQEKSISEGRNPYVVTAYLLKIFYKGEAEIRDITIKLHVCQSSVWRFEKHVKDMT